MFVHTESVREEIITQNIKKTKMIHTHTNIYIYIYEYIEKIKLGGKKGSIWTFDMRGDTHERIHHHRVNTKQFPSFNCKHKDQFGFLPLLLFLFFFLFWPAFCLDLLPEIWYKSDRNDSLFGREREREREREKEREKGKMRGKKNEMKAFWADGSAMIYPVVLGLNQTKWWIQRKLMKPPPTTVDRRTRTGQWIASN